MSDVREPSGAGACAMCGKPQVARYRPFCSKRCADVDLHKWLTGSYAIPAVEEDDPDQEGGGDAQGG